MNKKLTSLLLIIFVVCIAVVVYYNKITIQPIASTDPATLPVKEAILTMVESTEFKELPKEEKLVQVSELLEQLPPEYTKLKHQYLLAMSVFGGITFHGRVIDQYEKPVVNAQVRYEGAHDYLSAGSGLGAVYSDEQGYFEINASGASLSLGGIVHPEIEYSYPIERKVKSSISRYSRLRSRIIFAHGTNDPDFDNWKNYAEKENAYVISVWRLSKYEGAIESNTGLGAKRDGSISTLRISNKWGAKQILEGAQDGHLHISCTREHMETDHDFGNWTVTITPVNGGIVETDDVYMNVAPEAGYKPSLNINMRTDSAGYQPRLSNKRYYFTSNNGKEYGSLYAHFLPYYDYENEFCKIKLEYKLNPTGSRNLELKRSNTSQPQLPTLQRLASN